MKIVIRNSTFETNSSSHHTLILTNEQDYKADLSKMTAKMKKDCCWGGPHDALSTVEDKALFLGGLFDCDWKQYGLMGGEYQVFMKLLQDKATPELVEKVKANRDAFKEGKLGEPVCNQYFRQGELWDCTCPFSKAFRDYFQVRIDPYAVIGSMSKGEDFYTKAKAEQDSKSNELYRKLDEFIFGDGLIVPYEYL